MSKVSELKAYASRLIWRMKKSATIINLMFYSMTLAGVYLPYVSKMVDIHKLILLPLLSLTSCIALYIGGLLYDIVIRMWKEDNIIAAERNPYLNNLFSEKERLVMQVYLSNHEATYESMRTNIQICDHYGIETGSLKAELQQMKEFVEAFETWVKTGKISKSLL